MKEYLEVPLKEAEIEIANKRVQDFYPLRNIEYKNLFPAYNKWQAKMLKAAKDTVQRDELNGEKKDVQRDNKVQPIQ